MKIDRPDPLGDAIKQLDTERIPRDTRELLEDLMREIALLTPEELEAAGEALMRRKPDYIEVFDRVNKRGKRRRKPTPSRRAEQRLLRARKRLREKRIIEEFERRANSGSKVVNKMIDQRRIKCP